MAGKTTGWILMAGILLAGCSDFRVGGDTAESPPIGAKASTSTGTPAGRPSAMAGTRLVAQSRPPVADLPIPVGFAIVESVSRSYESAGARFVDHTYQARADKFEVERFVREQLPGKGWTLRGSQMVRGTFFLKYEKGNEFLDVTITGEDRPLLGETVKLTYNLQTLGRGEPRR